jgi:hypothetical protein
MKWKLMIALGPRLYFIVRRRAKYNTRHNRKYANTPVICDGFCAKRECVCKFIDQSPPLSR